MRRWKGILLFFIFLLGGCSAKLSKTDIPSSAEVKARLIAILPVENRTTDQTAPQMFREKLFEELYFKGYPKIPLKMVDEKISKIYSNSLDKGGGAVPPKIVGESLGVDAVMYCILNESKTSTFFFQSATSVSVSCDLRSSKTDAILWHAQKRVIKRSFDISHHSLKIKASKIYEVVFQEVVNEIIKTFPDGPDLSG